MLFEVQLQTFTFACRARLLGSAPTDQSCRFIPRKEYLNAEIGSAPRALQHQGTSASQASKFNSSGQR